MSGFDFGVLGILLVSLLIGLWRGLLYEVLSLLGWPMAFVLSKLLSDSVAALLPIEHQAMRVTAAYTLVFVAVLIAWGYGPMTSQAGLERQIQVLKVQVHELELDRVQKDSKIVILEHEVGELERHRERLVKDVIAYTRTHSLTGTLAPVSAEKAEQP